MMLCKILKFLFLLSFLTSTVYAKPFIEDELLRSIMDSSKQQDIIIRMADSSEFSVLQNKKDGINFLIRESKEKNKRSREKIKSIIDSKNVTNVKGLWLIDGFSLRTDAETINNMMQLPYISSISQDKILALKKTDYSTDISPSWNISQINAHVLWSFGYTGSGIIIAIMDSGVDIDNPHLTASFRGGTNSWFDPAGVHLTPYDAIGHGTQALGIILGSNNIDTTIGIAPSAKWIAAKIFNDAGTATTSGIHLSFQWILDPDNDSNTNDMPEILNCSWGIQEHVNECVTEFQQDISILRQAGIAVVFAAGNESTNPSYPSSVSPANYEDSISVGSVDSSSIIAYSSSRGPSACDSSIYPKLVAPGVSIETCDLSYGGIIDQHVYVDGTSFAAPHVSAAFALLMQAFPYANSNDIESALISSAIDLGNPGPDNSYGNGQIDAFAAYQLLALNYCNADFDHNYLVDFNDFEILANEWLLSGCNELCPCRCDLNSDGHIDFHDYVNFSFQFKRDSCSQ